ncbi:MAG: helix-turn-helix transcriptional regulator [Paenibacillaceae bacterium]|nr:helix-turn-helix transcriptional regulator [Paenibacillaceae bacterium]
MAYLYEQLANEFLKLPVDVYGVFRSAKEANQIFSGHVRQPTSKCAILIGLRGQADFIFNETECHRLTPGRGFVGALDKRLEIRTGDEGFEYFLIHYLPASAEALNTKLLTEISLFHVELASELLQVQEQLLRVASVPDSMGMLEKKSLFYRMLYMLLQSQRDLQNQGSSALVDDAVAYIQTHYAEPLTLDKLAARFQMKGKYFSYLFHKYTGIAPIDYLIRYRMNRAMELLFSTDVSIHEIAEAVGYADPNYFSRIYRMHAGLPPKQSRAQQRMR